MSEAAPFSRLVISLFGDIALQLVLQIRGVKFTRWILTLMLQYNILSVLQLSAVPGFCQRTGTLPPLLDSVVGGDMPGKSFSCPYGSKYAVLRPGYFNRKLHRYIPNPLRCFKCQSFGHSQTVCRGRFKYSRCISVGHASSDCNLEQKGMNCSKPHSSDSKLYPKWKTEIQIQEIKINRNISCSKAHKLIVPRLSQTYAQAIKPSLISSGTQTDQNSTNIIYPPL
ncbi:RNA-directed DNA polymerase from mobile element jockey [Trichonephila clavipes]|nr:RNA-directed DNA polymerase from mobile element jockey [Trichonephila clavipes]